MEDQGIMGLPMGPMQAPTANPPAPPEVAAAISAGRSMMTPNQISQDTLDAIGEEDPELVSRFYRLLAEADLPPELIDAMGKMVDAILAEPQNYQAIRAEFIAEGVPEELLPIDFDPAYFAALNIALDQLVEAEFGAPEVPAFAEGGPVMSPVASGLAQMGRNGDTMLAHITPSEARMLKMRGGSGTINPYTGLPEFFLKSIGRAVGKVFKGIGGAVKGAVKAIGGAVKDIASSPLGRIALTVAAVYFMGPAGLNFAGTAGSITGLTGATALGVNTAIASTAIGLASGQKFKDALKTGAVSGLLAGGGAALSGFDPYAAAQAATPLAQGPADQALGSLTENVAQNIRPDVLTPSQVSAMPSISADGAIQYGQPYENFARPMDQFARAATQTATDVGGEASSSFLDQAGNFVKSKLMPGGIEEAGKTAALEAQTVAQKAAIDTALKAYPAGTTLQSLPAEVQRGILDKAIAAGQSAYTSTLPGGFAKYAPSVGIGLGIAGLSGAFSPDQPKPPGIVPSETGFDLLRRNPEIYGVNVGGGRTVYPGQGILTLASGGLAKKAVKLEEKAARVEAKGKTEKAAKLYAKADAMSAKAAVKSGLSSMQSPTSLAAGVPTGMMINPEYEKFYNMVTAPGGLRLRGESGVGQYIEDQRPGESLAAYRTRYFQEAAKLLQEPKMYVEDPNYVAETDEEDEIVQDKITTAQQTLMPTNPIISVGGTTVPMVQVGGGTTSAPLYNPTSLTIGEMPKPLLTAPDFTPIATAAPVSVTAPTMEAPTGSMESVDYAPAVFTSPNMYQWHNPAYATSYGLAAQNNPYMVQEEETAVFKKGGIASLKEPKYFPRRNGHISGPGTETSDDIPAMLSDGEFVFTAKAVRAAGGGSRRVGAKRMYAMMKALERKANG